MKRANPVQTSSFVRVVADRAARPVAAGGALGLAAIIETVARAGGSGTMLPIALVVGLGSTLPLAGVHRRPLVSAATITMATSLTMVLFAGPLGTALVTLIAVWTLLVRRRIRGVRARAAERDASRRAIERSLLELTARGERARIARELHDVVAHHISMISIQADTARLATPGMPEQGARQLLTIGDTARAALTEMQRLLGVLREDSGDDVHARRPQPGLQQLLDLVDGARNAAGGGARLIVRGAVTELDPGIELTAYRIVQEALTNARRHAPGSAVDVELEYDADVLRLRIRDNGPGPPQTAGEHAPGQHGQRGRAGSSGHGLLGMRERVATVGGRLRTGPAAGGGFVVSAALPAERPGGAGAAG